MLLPPVQLRHLTIKLINPKTKTNGKKIKQNGNTNKNPRNNNNIHIKIPLFIILDAEEDNLIIILNYLLISYFC